MNSVESKTSDVPQITWNRILLKIKYSFYSTLLFFLFANPETFRVIQSIVGRTILLIDECGTPTPTGFFIHTALFFSTMLSLMLIPSE